MYDKVTYNDVKKLEIKLKELEDYVKDLYNTPAHKKHYMIRVIREIQNYIEQRVRYITENIGLLPVSVKFPFENFIYVYRAKQGYFESRINNALYRKPGSFKYNETTGKVESSPLGDFDEDGGENEVKSKLGDQIDKAIRGLFTDSEKEKRFKEKVMREVSAAREKAGSDFKIMVKVEKTDAGRPKVKISLKKKDG